MTANVTNVFSTSDERPYAMRQTTITTLRLTLILELGSWRIDELTAIDDRIELDKQPKIGFADTNWRDETHGR